MWCKAIFFPKIRPSLRFFSSIVSRCLRLLSWKHKGKVNQKTSRNKRYCCDEKMLEKVIFFLHMPSSIVVTFSIVNYSKFPVYLSVYFAYINLIEMWCLSVNPSYGCLLCLGSRETQPYTHLIFVLNSCFTVFWLDILYCQYILVCFKSSLFVLGPKKSSKFFKGFFRREIYLQLKAENRFL